MGDSVVSAGVVCAFVDGVEVVCVRRWVAGVVDIVEEKRPAGDLDVEWKDDGVVVIQSVVLFGRIQHTGDVAVSDVTIGVAFSLGATDGVEEQTEIRVGELVAGVVVVGVAFK